MHFGPAKGGDGSGAARDGYWLVGSYLRALCFAPLKPENS